MDYARFRERGEPAWLEAEVLLGRAGPRGAGLDHEELQRLAALHRVVAADYAWVRTHHPRSALATRLRALAFRGHRVLAPPEPPLAPRLLAWLARGYPGAFRRELDLVLACVALLVVGALLGASATALEPRFATVFLGEATWRELARGRAWTDALVDHRGPLLGSTIFTNNLGVAVTCWAGGLLLGVPTLLVLLFNGAMLGASLVATAHHGLLHRLVDFVALHGPLELFLVAVSGAAGLLLARGAVLRDGRPRSAVLAAHGRRSLALVGGTVPWFVLLGLLEGSFSAGHVLPAAVRALLGVALLGAFLAWALRAPAPEVVP